MGFVGKAQQHFSGQQVFLCRYVQGQRQFNSVDVDDFQTFTDLDFANYTRLSGTFGARQCQGADGDVVGEVWHGVSIRPEVVTKTQSVNPRQCIDEGTSGAHSPGAEAPHRFETNAALKGRSSTLVRTFMGSASSTRAGLLFDWLGV